jgi:hypothetical protein
MDAELANMKKEVEARDRWFLGIEESVKKIANALGERSKMIKTVKPVAAKSKSGHKK